MAMNCNGPKVVDIRRRMSDVLNEMDRKENEGSFYIPPRFQEVRDSDMLYAFVRSVAAYAIATCKLKELHELQSAGPSPISRKYRRRPSMVDDDIKLPSAIKDASDNQQLCSRAVATAYSRLILTCSTEAEDPRFFECLYYLVIAVAKIGVVTEQWSDIEAAISYLFRGEAFVRVHAAQVGVKEDSETVPRIIKSMGPVSTSLHPQEQEDAFELPPVGPRTSFSPGSPLGEIVRGMNSECARAARNIDVSQTRRERVQQHRPIKDKRIGLRAANPRHAASSPRKPHLPFSSADGTLQVSRPQGPVVSSRSPAVNLLLPGCHDRINQALESYENTFQRHLDNVRKVEGTF